MKITVEISLYPLQKKYKKPIKTFIRAMKAKQKIHVNTTAMSTYISGDYDKVMKVLTKELKVVHESIPHSATLIKIIPLDLAVQKGFLDI